MKYFPRKLLRLACISAAAFILGMIILASCQSRLIYFPRPYGSADVSRWDRQPGTTIIAYQTAAGSQQAYLLSQSDHPKNLWIVCGGNGTLALEWSDWLRENAPAEDAWLLIDLPGYGRCKGTPTSTSIRQSLQAALPAAASSLRWNLEKSDQRLRFFGHSLGSAVTLMAASEFDIRRGVLISPFTSTMDMSRVITGFPVGFLVWHRFDNRERLLEMAKRGNAAVFIVHGAKDEVIPVRMSRELAREVPAVVTLKEVPAGRHNDLTDVATAAIVEAIRHARSAR